MASLSGSAWKARNIDAGVYRPPCIVDKDIDRVHGLEVLDEMATIRVIHIQLKPFPTSGLDCATRLGVRERKRDVAMAVRSFNGTPGTGQSEAG